MMSYLTPGGKVWMMLLIFFLCYLISNALSVLILIPFADINGLNELYKIEDYTNPTIIIGLKIAQLVSAIGAFIVPTLIFTLLASKNKWSYLKLNSKPLLSSLILVFLLIITMSPFINWIVELNSKMILPEFMNDIEQWMKLMEEKAADLTKAFLKMNGIVDLVTNLFIIAFIAALGEELIFRGLLQKLLLDIFKNKHTAIWLSAIIFSAFHMQFYGFIPRMLLGAVLGYLFAWSGSLWLNIFAHFLNNGMAVLFSYLEQRNILSKEVETIGVSGTNGFIWVVFSVVLTTLILFGIYTMERKNNLYHN